MTGVGPPPCAITTFPSSLISNTLPSVDVFLIPIWSALKENLHCGYDGNLDKYVLKCHIGFHARSCRSAVLRKPFVPNLVHSAVVRHFFQIDGSRQYT